MFSAEEVQYQIFKQTAFNQDPGAPDGKLIPGEMSFNATRTRNELDNNQVQSDGFEREPALGNHNSQASGANISNLNWVGHLLMALCSSLVSAAFSGIYAINVTNGGTGYTSAPAVGFTGGVGGSGQTAIAVVLSGSVIAVVITNPGTGWTGAPNVTFTGGGGSGAAATAVLDGTKFKHVGKLAPGAPLYHIIEKGVPNAAPTIQFRKYYNMVMRRWSSSETVEGICSLSTDWIGSGQLVKANTSLDATPTEVTGSPCEYANMFFVEGGAHSGIIMNQETEIDITMKEKRVPNGTGKSLELRKGASRVRVSGRAYFEDETLANKMENATLTSLYTMISSPDGWLSRLAPEVKLGVGDWERDEEGGIVIPFTARSIKKVSASAPVEFTLVNGVSGY